MRFLSTRQIGRMSIFSIQRRRWSHRVNDGPISLAMVTRLDTQQAKIHGRGYEHRGLPMWLLKEGSLLGRKTW